MIVFYHYRQANLPDSIYSNFFIRESYTFVDFFFVLSGFVIAYNYNNIETKAQFSKYLKKRFARLFPLLFFSTTLFLFYVIAKEFSLSNSLIPSSHFGISEQLGYGHIIERYLDTLLFTNSTPILGNSNGINSPTWSISAEMISYFVFGLVMLWSKPKLKGLILSVIIITGAAFCVAQENYFNTGGTGFLRGLIAFNFGFFVWHLSKKNWSVPNWVEFVLPIVLVLLLYQLHELKGPPKEMFGLFTLPIFFSVFILLFLKSNGPISRILNGPKCRFLGEVSYSVYLNHLLFVTLVPKVLFKLLKIPQNSKTEIIVFVFTVSLVLAYSYLTYIWVERKLGRQLRHWLISK